MATPLALTSPRRSVHPSACSLQRGYNHDPTPQLGCRYAFVWAVDHQTYEADPFGWDGDDLLWTAVVLSRLVRDNGYSLEYAARIIMCRDEVAEVIPVGAGGLLLTGCARGNATG